MILSKLKSVLTKTKAYLSNRTRQINSFIIAAVAIIISILVLEVASGKEIYRTMTKPVPLAAAQPELLLPTYSPLTDNLIAQGGIVRKALLHTAVKAKPPNSLVQYAVQSGDTVFGIAKKYGLKPSTILWANLDTLGDDPHKLSPGKVLNIMPLDGATYVWHANDSLAKVASYFHVKPEDILNFEGNHLDPKTIGDYSHPNIKPGTNLIIPGGEREFINWSAPQITRQNPGVAKLYGPGACGAVYTGLVGSGVFVWPTIQHWISGFDYDPSANHPAIDIAGQMGNAIYAADSGVIVYAGWNDWGYGNVIVIDHGNGWQTLYAHLSNIKVGCGASVSSGAIIGLMGSTGNSSGPHLHFEMMLGSTKVNPHQYLPAP